jgi:hypothetical protein
MSVLPRRRICLHLLRRAGSPASTYGTSMLAAAALRVPCICGHRRRLAMRFMGIPGQAMSSNVHVRLPSAVVTPLVPTTSPS